MNRVDWQSSPVQSGICLKSNAWVSAAHEVEQLIGVFTDERFQMMTSNVVPFDAVTVKVVQDREARFVVALSSFSVIRLSSSSTAGCRPVAAVALACWSNFSTGSTPKPSIDVGGLKVWTVASVEVTFTTRCPDVSVNIIHKIKCFKKWILNKLLNLNLLIGLKYSKAVWDICEIYGEDT